MSRIPKSVVTLRVMGDTLVPAEVTAALGCSPTYSQYKGEPIVGRSTGAVREARTGMWRLESSNREPEDIDAQIEELLGKLSADLAAWEHLATRLQIDLFCGLFMGETNDGLVLSSKSLGALAARRIALSLDIYAPDDDARA